MPDVGNDMLRTVMNEFPRDIRPFHEQAATTIICPDCGGSIRVRAVDGDVSDSARLVFQCRVGHTYALDELLIGKEQHIERLMWAAVYAYEELGGILRTISGRDGADVKSLSDEQYRERTLRADEIASTLRSLIQKDDAIKLKAHGDGA